MSNINVTGQQAYFNEDAKFFKDVYIYGTLYYDFETKNVTEVFQNIEVKENAEFLSDVYINGNLSVGILTVRKRLDVGIGSAYASVDSCFRGGCVSANCTNFASQIAIKESQVTILQSELDDLVPSVNSLKTERVDYQVIRWADKYSIRTLKEENERIKISLGILDDAKYDAYI